MSDHAIENAYAWIRSIESMLQAADDSSWDELEELRENEDRTTEENERLAELEAMESEFVDCADAQAQIQQAPLEITLTGKWSPGVTPQATGYIILLSTGGPALRIVGDLDDHGHPDSATLQWQDWGTGWTNNYSADDSDLMAFVSNFYFGE